MAYGSVSILLSGKFKIPASLFKQWARQAQNVPDGWVMTEPVVAITDKTSPCYPQGVGQVLWLTGLSGAGKSTITQGLAVLLTKTECRFEVLDGDLVRPYLSQELGYSRADRLLNVERIAFVASLLARHGVLVLVPVIAPYEEARAKAKAIIGAARYKEIYVKASLEALTSRDPKGLYKKALAGEIQHFTGISDVYEVPETPDLILETDTGQSVDACVAQLWNWGAEKKLWPAFRHAASSLDSAANY